MRRPPLAFAALGPPQNVMLVAGARVRVVAAASGCARRAGSAWHPRLCSLVRLRASSRLSFCRAGVGVQLVTRRSSRLRALQLLPESSLDAARLKRPRHKDQALQHAAQHGHSNVRPHELRQVEGRRRRGGRRGPALPTAAARRHAPRRLDDGRDHRLGRLVRDAHRARQV